MSEVHMISGLLLRLSLAFCFHATVTSSYPGPSAKTDYKAHQSHIIGYLLKNRNPEFNFNATLLEHRLIETAVATSTGTIEFHQELKALIREDLSFGLRKTLEMKYNIKDKPYTTDTITYARLGLMYPQYCNLDKILRILDKESEKVDPDCLRLDVYVPSLMRHREFGGLIPTWEGGALNQTDVKNLVLAHLFWLTCASANRDMKDLGRKIGLRMQLSRLSDKARVNLLRNEGIIEKNGTLVNTLVWVRDRDIVKRVENELFSELGWSK